MEKINFENLPSTNTPLNADNLNGMQNKIEKSANYIGTTQPATTEKVWFKKGKNLANLPYTVNNKKTITATSNDYYELTDYAVYLEAGKTYTLSFETDGTPGTSTTEDTVQVFLVLNKHDATLFATTTSTTLTFNVTVTGKYYFRFDVNQNGKTHRFWNIQVEQGSTATTYEAYVDKEILLKNNNGVFEKFYDENLVTGWSIADLTNYVTGIVKYIQIGKVVIVVFDDFQVAQDITAHGIEIVTGLPKALDYTRTTLIGFPTPEGFRIAITGNGTIMNHYSTPTASSKNFYGNLIYIAK